jgi:TM2 domain-containing membrane protein YozV/RNA polymerase subunit RPABC4/transcription elongation factor Spt4
MKYCVSCGEQIQDEADICTECGINQTASLDTSYGDRAENEKYCKDCGELINRQAEVCPECGIRQQAIGTDANTDKITAGVLAVVLGSLGAHKFYQGRTGLGFLYLCFFWTFIPFILSLTEGILILLADERTYEEKYADGSILGRL